MCYKLEANHLSSRSNMSSGNIINKIPTLDSTNYLEWKDIMTAYLHSKGLWQIIIGGEAQATTPPATASDEEKEKVRVKQLEWANKGDQALGIIQLKTT